MSTKIVFLALGCTCTHCTSLPLATPMTRGQHIFCSASRDASLVKIFTKFPLVVFTWSC